MTDEGGITTGTGAVVGPKEVQKPDAFKQLMKPDTLAPKQEQTYTYRVVLPKSEQHHHDTTFIIRGKTTHGDLQALLQSGELSTKPDSEFKCEIVERGTGRRYDVNLNTVIAYVGKQEVTVERAVTEADRFASARKWTAEKGTDVAGMQKMLAGLGYLDPSQQSGKFDLTTYRAIVKFQGDNKIGVDGKFGQQTLAAAKSVLGPTITPPTTKITEAQTNAELQVCDTNDFFEFRADSKPAVSPGTKRGPVTPTSGDAVAFSDSQTTVVPKEQGERTVAFSDGVHRGKLIPHYGDLTSEGAQRGSTVVGSGDVNAPGDHKTTVLEGSGAYRGKITPPAVARKKEDEEEDKGS